jgi:hypothetical protein
MQRTEPPTALVGVYHADGGRIGEAKYVIGRLMGTAHCSLCDITHTPVRRKPEWDRMVARLAIPFALVHLNEMPGEIAAATARSGSPVVLARHADGRVEPLLLPGDLERLGGSVAAFEAAVRSALRPGSAVVMDPVDASASTSTPHAGTDRA